MVSTGYVFANTNTKKYSCIPAGAFADADRTLYNPVVFKSLRFICAYCHPDGFSLVLNTLKESFTKTRFLCMAMFWCQTA